MKPGFALLFFVLLTFAAAGQKAYYFLATSPSNITLEEAKSLDYKSIGKGHWNVGFSDCQVWIKVIPKGNIQGLLRLSCPVLDSVGIYKEYSSGRITTELNGLLVESRDKLYVNPIATPIDSSSVIYLSVKSRSMKWDSLDIVTLSKYQSDATLGIIIWASFMGIFLVMVIKAISLYLKLRERAYLHYSIFIIGAMCQSFHITGIGAQLFWSGTPQFSLVSEGLFVGLMILGHALFTREVLRLKEVSRSFYLAFTTMIFVGLLIMALAFLLPARLTSIVAHMAAGATMFLELICAFYLIRKLPYARLYLIGWFLFNCFATSLILLNMGLISPNVIVFYLPFVGLLIEIMVFNWVVAHYIASIKKDGESALQELVEKTKQLDQLQKLLEDSVFSEDSLQVMEPMINLKQVSNSLVQPLSKREIDVFDELQKGFTYQQIADRLFISKSTVKSHVRSIYEKLDARNRTDAINKVRGK